VGQFFTARRLKDIESTLWECLGVGKKIVVVATSAQKFYLKNALLTSKKGGWGIEIVTPGPLY